MKRKPAFLLVLVLLLFAAGCAKTPRARWAQARASLTSAQDMFAELYKAGIVDDPKVVVEITDGFLATQKALENAKMYITRNGDVDESNEDKFYILMLGAHAGLKEWTKYKTQELNMKE